MRSKASLSLMELLVMLLVFAVAAALCLRTFARSHEVSLETARRDVAVTMAQNAAELLKSGEEPEHIEKKLSNDTCTVQICALPQEIPGLVQAEILAFYEGAELFTLTVGYPEEKP